MNIPLSRIACLAACAALLSCGSATTFGFDAGTFPDAGLDAGGPDSGLDDGGLEDGGPDAGLDDGGLDDGGPDGGIRDGGLEDGGLEDGGLEDGGRDGGIDGGGLDAGTDGGIDGSGHDGGPDAGGAPDAGHGGDAGIDAGTTPDAGCPYVFCEDFEGYDAGTITNGALLGPWLATVQSPLTTLAIDPNAGIDGSQALRITVAYEEDGGSARGTLNHHTDGGALVGPDLFGRAEIFYATDDDAGLPLNVHSWIFNAAGETPDGGSTSMNMGGGGNRAQLNYQYVRPPKLSDGGYELMEDGGPFPTEAAAQGGTLTAGAWHCLQWEYGGAPANVGNVWIDGTAAITVNDPTPMTNWVLSDAYNSIDLGFTHYQVLPNGIDLYIDNFALDTQMIPCP